VEEPQWRKQEKTLPAQLKRAAALALTEADDAPPGSLTLLLSNDARLQALNARFRAKDKPTNVLSFAADDGGDYLGDIAIAYGVTSREAKAQKKPFAAHAVHLTVHGVLHLLGYDHEKPADAKRMEKREVDVLERLRIPDPYRSPTRARAGDFRKTKTG